MANKLPDYVMEALATIQSNSLIEANNGTVGQVYEGWFWNHTKLVTKEIRQLQAQLMSATFGNASEEELSGIESKLAILTKDVKVDFVFRLLTPIPLLVGTKTATVGSVTKGLKMENVTDIHLHQNMLKYVSFEKTQKKRQAIGGADQPVYRMKLDSALLEVVEEWRDFNDPNKITKPKTARVSNLSYSTMQAVGGLVRSISNERTRMMGYTDMAEIMAIAK